MKKRTIWIIGIVFVIVVAIGIGYAIYTANGTVLERKAKQIFGTEYCTTNHYLEMAGDAFTDWKCALCGKEGTNPDTNVPAICGDCARATGRCMQCGKLEK